jgi:transcriptional regulator with XRE-family HTH domain
MLNPVEIAEKAKALHILQEQMEEEPWIRFRNKIVADLINKRRELGVTQKSIADAMDIPHTSITRFESMVIVKKGKPVSPPNPTLKYLASYAAVLGLDIEFKFVPSSK